MAPEDPLALGIPEAPLLARRRTALGPVLPATRPDDPEASCIAFMIFPAEGRNQAGDQVREGVKGAYQDQRARDEGGVVRDMGILAHTVFKP